MDHLDCECMKTLLEEFDALAASVRNASGTPAGRLRLTAPMSTGAVQLATALKRVAFNLPHIL